VALIGTNAKKNAPQLFVKEEINNGYHKWYWRSVSCI
jgi:hypothetical protein